MIPLPPSRQHAGSGKHSEQRPSHLMEKLSRHLPPSPQHNSSRFPSCRNPLKSHGHHLIAKLVAPASLPASDEDSVNYGRKCPRSISANTARCSYAVIRARCLPLVNLLIARCRQGRRRYRRSPSTLNRPPPPLHPRSGTFSIHPHHSPLVPGLSPP